MAGKAAAAAMKEMMDQLMGSSRDEMPKEGDDSKPKWQEENVCKMHLVHVCPHDLFHNTKSDLGACRKRHDEGLKTQFEMANDVKHKGLYAKELLPVLEGLESDMDRNIQRTKVRLTQEMPAIQDPKTTGKIQEIMEQIKGFQADIERYGEEGEVDKAEDANKKVALLIGEKERIEKAELDPYGQREKTQTICEVCGNIAQSTDNEQRKQNHLEGKQHKGFVAIRAAIPELRDMIEAARAADPDFDKDGSARGGPDAIAAQPSDRERRREDAPRDDDRRRDRSRERRDRSRSRDRKRDRSGERDRYRSSRDYRGSDRTRDDYRSSDRDRRRDRSRSRDRRR